MIVKTVSGDLLKLFREDHFDAIVHGCNCFHTMGAGIARQIAVEFPEAYMTDQITRYGDRYKLGTYSVTKTKFGRIFNAYTQFLPGKEVLSILYPAITKSFAKINYRHTGPKQGMKKATIGIPRIGAGIAGGYWEDISALINEVTPDIDIVLVNWKP
jgi:O-acetyl-ADP-ribose deacetylase (regulator of RNase III)